MHRAAYAQLGLAWTYEAREVDAEGLADVLASLDSSWRGLSLTMPLKRAAVPLCDVLSATARRVGAVNTVLLTGKSRSGDNTDVPGFAAALAERGVRKVESAVVLGAGATALSATAALTDLGLERLHLAVREPRRAVTTRDVVAGWGVQVEVGLLEQSARPGGCPADLLVSTVPAAAAEAFSSVLGEVPTVFDVVYDPWPTALSTAAEQVGATVLTGLDLLAHQARLQVRAMTGLDVGVEDLREAARAELALRRAR
jgi:shikimate dehydrogenase